jgi:hypothetical protein
LWCLGSGADLPWAILWQPGDSVAFFLALPELGMFVVRVRPFEPKTRQTRPERRLNFTVRIGSSASPYRRPRTMQMFRSQQNEENQ